MTNRSQKPKQTLTPQAPTLLWATDVHLDHFPHPGAARVFGAGLREENPEASGLILTGDIAEAPTVEQTLRDVRAGFGHPVYFVLGNHDYYRGSFASVDGNMAALHSANPGLHALRHGCVRLTQGVALVGNDGWYDARFGNAETDLQLNDFRLIDELFVAQDESRAALIQTIRARADALASELSAQLATVCEAANAPHTVIVATHVPPFQQAAWHEGQSSDERWAPFFSSKATGDVLLRRAVEYPQVQFVVLCGHTHGAGVYQPRDNLVVYTGKARYGAPELAGQVQVRAGSVAVVPNAE